MIRNIFVLMILTLSSQSLFSQEDPYLWLEEIEGEKSMEWVKNQNIKSKTKIESISGFEGLKNSFLASMNDDEKIDYPTVINDMVYNFWKDENHARGIWRRTSLEKYMINECEWEVILDLDKLSKEDNAKWVFHGATWLAPNFEKCLISLSDGGTDEGIVREFNVVKKAFVKGGFELPSSKGGAAWVNEDELLITRNFGEGTMTASGYPRVAKSLKRGQSFDDATVVMEAASDIMGLWPGSDYIDGKHQVILYKSYSFYSHDVYSLVDEEFIRLDLPKDSEIQGSFKGMLLVRLNSHWLAKNDSESLYSSGDLVAIDEALLKKGTLKVNLLFRPDIATSIEGVSVTKDGILLNIIQNVKSVLLKLSYSDGKWPISTVDTPEFGQISIIDSDREKSDYFYLYSNFITPPTLYHKSGANTTTIRQGKNKFESDNLEVHQYESKSKDGTKVPYFIIHKKDIVLDGSNPTLVYAYGGFNVSVKPGYNTRTGIGWLEQGGVYVVANIRGGGEFGPAWHQGAMKEKRQNAYDDFYSVCEDVIERRITSPKHLGAFGWSNGGLMAGVVATQRPDLFNAVIIGAPLLDMKRFNKMLAGASWMGEYGNPDVPEEWEYIKKYSPYHNVHKGTEYPEVLIITSTKDDRVHPGHARKMAAKMTEQGHPMYYYETIEGGHGAASTNEQAAFNQALMFTYLKMKLMK